MKILSSFLIFLCVLHLARSDSLRSKLAEKLQVHGECGAFGSCPSGQSCDIGRIPWTCYDSPRAHDQPCTLAGGMHDSCKSGLTCAPGHHRCYNSPRQEGEPCEAGNPCGNGLNCAPSDAPYYKCKKLPDLNEDCDPVFNKCQSGLNCAINDYGRFNCVRIPTLYERCDPFYNPCASGLFCKLSDLYDWSCYCNSNLGCERNGDVYNAEVFQYGYWNNIYSASDRFKTCNMDSGLCLECDTDEQCTANKDFKCVLIKQRGFAEYGWKDTAYAWYKFCRTPLPANSPCLRDKDCQANFCKVGEGLNPLDKLLMVEGICQ